MKIPFDSYAYTNRLRQLPPGQKLLFAASLLAIALLAHWQVHLLIFAWLSLWIVKYAGIPWRTYLRLLLLPAAFMLMSLPPLCLEAASGDGAASAAADAVAAVQVAGSCVYLSQSGLLRAFAVLARALASVACLYFLLFTVPLGELLQVLRRLGMPVILIELLSIMYRFVFVLLEVAGQLWVAQQARGGHNGFRSTLRDVAKLAVTLFGRTWHRYRQLVVGLAARGFSGEIRVVSTARFVRSKRYLSEAVLGCLALIALEWWTGR
ncbi:cobalt ECF transporter T component CbiQ [Brevibacillus massiliensis]|jgi:cobalt/nickel transport system permease protein|uniref:cobalt ECF transporter T component CbiQ n=1 Tax=Brevibacillus massiliensis TaxID=1118054 RepID=UPI0003112AFE|nr:cobalt ECF transporter T component CbiQ [Brevibacillus massiliensis]